MIDICICPVCKRKYEKQIPLRCEQKRYICSNGHSFDRSAKGYVNLLTPSAGAHGDNREMVLSRSRLLSSGIYAPFRNALIDQLKQLPEGAVIWDSGCGEGYYTAAAAECNRSFSVYGSDLSTAALTAAHKRCNELSLFAASSYALPADNQTCDAVMCLFAPEAIEEFLRVLKPGGVLLLGIPGKRHLFGLKQILYDNPYENQPRSSDLLGFELAENKEICYDITLNDGDLIQSLFSMTPYAYRTGAEGKRRLQETDLLQTPLHFHILMYRKL